MLYAPWILPTNKNLSPPAPSGMEQFGSSLGS